MIINNQQNYKYQVYIGKGNNQKLVEAAFKRRGWWKITDQIDQNTQLLWTCLKNQQFIDQLNSLRDSKLIYSEQYKNQQTKIDQNTLKILNFYDASNIQKSLKFTSQINKFENEILKFKPKIRKITQINYKSHNHLDKNYHMTNKKALFYNLKQYCEQIKDDPFKYIPVTFHLQNGINDKEYQRFLDFYSQRQIEIKNWEQLSEQDKKCNIQPRNIYIIKPGEITNRGYGIKVESDLDEITNIFKKKEYHKNGNLKTYIIQLYIDRPFLYNKRKFDIRCYLLITSQNSILKGYWYKEGYIRTSSILFSLKNLSNKMIHLTNDAIQKNSDEYGKYETGNKISFKDFEKYLESNHPNQKFNEIQNQMEKLAAMSIKSVFGQLDPYKKDNTFEIYGLDFMIDEDFKIYLIEVNTNPCLEISSTLLARLIPNMIENAIKIAIDTIFPPPDAQKLNTIKNYQIHENMLDSNQFKLIFDELLDGKDLQAYIPIRVTQDNQFYDIEEQSQDDESQEIYR